MSDICQVRCHFYPYLMGATRIVYALRDTSGFIAFRIRSLRDPPESDEEPYVHLEIVFEVPSGEASTLVDDMSDRDGFESAGIEEMELSTAESG